VDEQNSRKIQFSTVGIVIGILLVIMSLVWVTKAVITGNKQSGEDVTWVG